MIKTFGVNDGHTISGAGSGAVGRINESEHTRLVGNEVRRLFKENNQKVVNCTIDYSNSTNENLNLIVQQANRQELDWFISIHFNAGGGQGVEVYTYEGRQYQDALNVCSNIAALGFKNRGVKAGTGLYVIRKTKAKSMLIEVCFVDTDDADKYLNVGHKAIAKAIVEGVLGAIKEDNTPGPSTQWALNLQKELNKQGYRDKNGNKLAEDGIAGKRTLEACPTLKQGAKGNITRLLQEKLNQFGYTTNGIDGIFGNGTYNAIVAYQRNKGIGADGIVGKATWGKILGL